MLCDFDFDLETFSLLLLSETCVLCDFSLMFLYLRFRLGLPVAVLLFACCFVSCFFLLLFALCKGQLHSFGVFWDVWHLSFFFQPLYLHLSWSRHVVDGFLLFISVCYA